MAQASSVYEKVKVMYSRIAPAVAMANPAVPPAARPRFHPKYIPEITYPTPRPHNIQGPKVRDSAVFWLMPKYKQLPPQSPEPSRRRRNAKAHQLSQNSLGEYKVTFCGTFASLKLISVCGYNSRLGIGLPVTLVSAGLPVLRHNTQASGFRNKAIDSCDAICAIAASVVPGNTPF